MKKMRLTVLCMALGIAFSVFGFAGCKPQADDATNNNEPQKTQEEIEAEEKAKKFQENLAKFKQDFSGKTFIDIEFDNIYYGTPLLNTKKVTVDDEKIRLTDITNNTYKDYPYFSLYKIEVNNSDIQLYFGNENNSDKFIFDYEFSEHEICAYDIPNGWIYFLLTDVSGNENNGTTDTIEAAKLTGINWKCSSGHSKQSNNTLSFTSSNWTFTDNSTSSSQTFSGSWSEKNGKLHMEWVDDIYGSGQKIEDDFTVELSDTTLKLTPSGTSTFLISIFKIADSSVTFTK